MFYISQKFFFNDIFGSNESKFHGSCEILYVAVFTATVIYREFEKYNKTKSINYLLSLVSLQRPIDHFQTLSCHIGPHSLRYLLCLRRTAANRETVIVHLRSKTQPPPSTWIHFNYTCRWLKTITAKKNPIWFLLFSLNLFEYLM